MSDTDSGGIFKDALNAQAVNAGTTIFKAGDAAHCMYGIKRGTVKIIIKNHHVETVEAGGVFGEMAIIEGGVRTGTAVADTDAELVPIDEKHYQFLVQQAPYFALEMLRTLTRRLRRMDETYLK
jgi:CRP/FNR family transcriptional regulator, cyclic AMP receptor protein